MMYIIKRNASTVHIDGFDGVSQGEFTYAENACGALTRGRFATVKTVDGTAAQALEAAELTAKVTGKKLCKNCAAAAQRLIEAEAETEAETVTEEAPIVAALNGRPAVWMVQEQGRTMWIAEGVAGLFTSKERAQRALA